MKRLKWLGTFPHLLDQPFKVAVICLAAFAFHCLNDGVLWRLWGLYRDEERISQEISTMRSQIKSLKGSLIEAKDPAFIERQARDRLDLVRENDLVFVFPQE